MGPFNNREIATGVWLLVALVFVLQKGGVGRSLFGVLAAFFHPKVFASVILMILYITAVAMALSSIGIWSTALLKDTIMWFIISGIALMIRFSTAYDADNVFQQLFVDSIKVVIFLEFVVNTYSVTAFFAAPFSFPVRYGLGREIRARVPEVRPRYWKRQRIEAIRTTSNPQAWAS